MNPHYLIYISPKKLKKNFQVFNITLVDHIIIGKGNYFSINLNKNIISLNKNLKNTLLKFKNIVKLLWFSV
ncbi:hypothetical protein SHM_18140 [Spiroplasma ixodetis]|uniref:RadC-like JAB domain-containing protein n=1 Tax=Spiroplasma ixodetis TaxID=2141 RepID=A0ABM8BWB8_9MOLU|nr:hypothetical protein SHM_18140 [Spiroplasma ixodetis]